MTESQKDKIVFTYYNHKELNFKNIARLLSVSQRAVSRVLVEKGINTKLKNRYIIKNIDYFKNIDTEFKAYILGFIYADGYVGDHNEFVIALSDKVEDNFKILDRLKKELGLSLEINHIQNKYGSYVLKFVSKEIVRDLNNLGVYPRKSLTMEYFPEIREDLVHHFIRGYFDGDGSIYSYFDKYDSRIRNGFEILGTEKFLLKMQKKDC